jgi:hypothetical protein
MAFFEAKLGEDVFVYVESESSGAFAKNAVETGMVPAAAFDNMVKIASGVAKAFGDGVKATLPPGATAELNFGIKAELSGTVMVATSPGSGQFSVTVRVVNA